MGDLQEMRIELKNLRAKFFNGEPVSEQMNALAVKCADLYNEKARAVAKKHGTKPSLTTASRIMRQAEYLR